MIKTKLEIRIWKPGISFEFNMLKWAFSYSIDKNQHAKYAKFHFGPFVLGFIWDGDPFNN